MAAKIELKAAAVANDTVALIGWDWPHDTRIPGCLGFALTRIDKSGKRHVIETKLPFTGQTNKDWRSEPSTVWPIQRKFWLDYTGEKDQTYSYEVQALGGKPGALTALDGIVATSNQVTLSTKVDETFQVAFTRGVLSTQWLARMIGLNAEGEPNFEKLIEALKDYENPDNVIRRTLVANVPELLMAPIKECAADGGHAYLALYELADRQLVEFLKANIKHFSLILGNTGKEDLTNAEARKELHEIGADIQDRMIGDWGIAHNKSQVKTNAKRKPTDVTTGSTNWTMTGLSCQSNMVTRIFNEKVADNFMDYWQRLLAEKNDQSPEFRARNAKGYEPVTLSDGTVIETWFQPSMAEKVKPRDKTQVQLSPFLKRVKELMEGAKDVLCGEVFYPGSPSVVHWMAEIWDKRPDLYAFMTVSSPDALRGIKAKRRKGRQPIFTIATGREKDFADFVKELLKLPDAHAITHGKIIVIDPWGDKPVVIFGSDNLGAKASYGNDENAVIVIGNKRLAQFVFVNMFDINKHYQSRAAARAHRFSKKRDPNYSPRLDNDDSWQDAHLSGYKAREAQLLATGVWDGSGMEDGPDVVSDWVVPFQPRPKTSGIVGPSPEDLEEALAVSAEADLYQHFSAEVWD